jgi:hypothetical protein
MFSAFSASDSSASSAAWSAYADFDEAFDEQISVLKLNEAANDNCDVDAADASRTQPCVPIDPDSLRDWDDD